jgi:hypothetical protein
VTHGELDGPLTRDQAAARRRLVVGARSDARDEARRMVWGEVRNGPGTLL